MLPQGPLRRRAAGEGARRAACASTGRSSRSSHPRAGAMCRSCSQGLDGSRLLAGLPLGPVVSRISRMALRWPSRRSEPRTEIDGLARRWPWIKFGGSQTMRKWTRSGELRVAGSNRRTRFQSICRKDARFACFIPTSR